MKPLLLYFLLGAIVAVWTAINQLNRPQRDEGDAPALSYAAAYLLIALAWPVSVVISVYALVTDLLVDSR